MITNKRNEKPVIILGAGMHSKVLIDLISKSGRKIIGLTDPGKTIGEDCLGFPVLGADHKVFEYSPLEIDLVNGVAEFSKKALRIKITKIMHDRGYFFTPVIHPTALIASNVKLSEGVQIMAGAIIQSGAEIKSSTIINTGAIVDHNCIINEHCHIAPGVILNGSVIIGAYTHIGTGTVVIQNVTVGENCIVAAGSVIYKDVLSNIKVIQQRITQLEGTL